MYGKLSEDELETYRKVGKLTAEIKEKAQEMIEPEQKLLDVAEEVEGMIREKGAEPAFPCNTSLNEKAAHYSPPAEDETEIEEGDLLKIDMGAHIDGYIADTAVTVQAGAENSDMIQAVDRILKKAISKVKAGANVGEIGATIEKSAEEEGYKPISNLTGHNLERWSLHGGISIPNVEKETDDILEAGEVIAIEPFITDGKGEVEDMPEVYIFKCTGNRDVPGRMAQQTLRKINSKYRDLPFAERWLTEDLSRIRLQMTLRQLLASEALHPYYVLGEAEEGLVAQAEDTMIVTEEGCEVTTKL